jgi:hypothetical protein
MYGQMWGILPCKKMMGVGYINDGRHLPCKSITATLSINPYDMKTMLALPGFPKKAQNTVLILPKMARKNRRRGASSHLTPKNVKKPYFKFYKVFKNETSVNEVFTNSFEIFKPTHLKIKAACALNSREHPAFFLPADEFMFCGFLSRIKAMEYAKAEALKYINKLINDGEKSYKLLLKYREVHYEDLNINLIDRNIRKLELVSSEG